MIARRFAVVSLALVAACGSQSTQPDSFPNARTATEPCTVTPGTTVTLASDVAPEFLMATAHHVYFSTANDDANAPTATLSRIHVDGPSTAQAVTMLDADTAFAVTGSVVLTPSGSIPVLAKIGVDGESGNDVSNGAGTELTTASFDGSTLFASFRGGTRLAELPLSGPPVVVALEPTMITGIAAVDGVAFVATYDTAHANGTISSYASGSPSPTTLLDDIGSVTNIVADSYYVYFTSIANDAHQAIYRMRHDGSARSVVVDDVGGSFAIDGANVYYVKAGQLTRHTQTTGETGVLATLSPNAKPLVVVHGGNVYWGYPPEGGLSGPTTPGAIQTTCK